MCRSAIIVLLSGGKGSKKIKKFPFGNFVSNMMRRSNFFIGMTFKFPIGYAKMK